MRPGVGGLDLEDARVAARRPRRPAAARRARSPRPRRASTWSGAICEDVLVGRGRLGEPPFLTCTSASESQGCAKRGFSRAVRSSTARRLVEAAREAQVVAEHDRVLGAEGSPPSRAAAARRWRARTGGRRCRRPPASGGPSRRPGSSASTAVRSRIAVAGSVRTTDMPRLSRGTRRWPSFGSRSGAPAATRAAAAAGHVAEGAQPLRGLGVDAGRGRRRGPRERRPPASAASPRGARSRSRRGSRVSPGSFSRS